MQKISLIIGVIVLVLGVGYLATSSKDDTQVAKTTANTETVPLESNQPIAEVDTPSTVESAEDASRVASVPGSYSAYDASKIAASDAEHILLFFHATWCPSCRALDTDIVKNAANIPAGVEIYKVDYDTSVELKRKYGVTTQHSIIEINKSGEAESSISHPLTLEGVLETI